MSQIKKDLNSFKVLLKAFNLKTMPENEGYMSSYIDLENLRNANIIFTRSLWALRARLLVGGPSGHFRPFGPAFGPSGLLTP